MLAKRGVVLVEKAWKLQEEGVEAKVWVPSGKSKV